VGVLTGGANIAQLAKDAMRLNADIAITCHDHLLDDLRSLLDGTGVAVASGDAAIADAATRPADWTLSAIIGAAGLVPGLRALEQGGTLALAGRLRICKTQPLHRHHPIPIGIWASG